MMKIPRWLLLTLIPLVLSSCTQYIYQGRITAEDSLGKEREHVLYWNKTHRKLWFDSVAGSLTLLSECSNNTVQYDEQEQGIIFRKRPNDKIVVPHSGNDCGKVLGHTRIKHVEEGQLNLTMQCEPEVDEFTVGGVDSYLKARADPYLFPVTKRVTKNLQADAPKRPPCRD